MAEQINGTAPEKIDYLIEKLTEQPSWKIKFGKSKGNMVFDFGNLKLSLGSDGQWWITT